MVLRQLGSHMQKNKVGPLPHKIQNAKIITKWNKDLNVKAEAMMFLE